ncbi:serine/threonine-protein phosphatase 6 regulatory subunit 3 isoform X2 [Aethina tumida]|uniref:serine/threonine-protein phosphatase 6 regulatory subunit 3 isoform X2 n=1 Tax=Aethina tumida TaxID=116153 RepID=UPI00096B1535|nr:serine/threonine-protein phosphatase 6 regulatory subunit 3 isoform X2 [Aethina tumida]
MLFFGGKNNARPYNWQRSRLKMFWKQLTPSSSGIETILAKEDVTLQEIMDTEYIINDCRGQNKVLIDFLLKPEIMEELIGLVTKEPSSEIEERSRFKYPNIACELLTCDVPALNERLASDEALLNKLYSFLECDKLNPLLASYFSKIMGTLIARKTEQNWLSSQVTCLQVLDFLKAKVTFITLMLKHLGTSAIMDLMLKIMTGVEGVESRQNILNWLDSQRVMQSLVSLLNPKIDNERHYNVAQLLCDFIKTARDSLRNSTERADPDPLLNTLESPETISLLLDQILNEEKSETAIVGGIQVLLALLDVYQCNIPKYSAQNMYSTNINDEANDIEQKQKIISNTTQSIRHRLADFHSLLLDPPNKSPINTTVGVLDPPLGNTRLQIVRLLASIISSNNEELIQELVNLGTFQVMLDLFFKYPWNNFLHTQVENCLISALKTYVNDGNDENSNALCKHLLIDCKLIERILDAWKENEELQSQEKGVRRGYMGHLISILNKLVDLCSSISLGEYFKTNLPEVAKSLDEFKETTLSETNKLQDSLLGGAHPKSSIEDNEDYGVHVTYSQSNAMQQQNLMQSYIVDYSEFNDDAFNDVDDTLQTIDHRSDMNFDISEGDFAQHHEMFKQVCAQNINTLDDADDQIFEEREQTFQTVIEKRTSSYAAYSSDSDDESPPAEDAMDVDPWASPKAATPPVVSIVTQDPWGTGDNANSDSNVGGWADFSNAGFKANFQDTEKSEDVKAPVVEKDLQLENVAEVVDEDKTGPKEDPKNEKVDSSAKESVTKNAAGGDQAKESQIENVKPKECSEPEPSKSIDTKPAAEVVEEDKDPSKL